MATSSRDPGHQELADSPGTSSRLQLALDLVRDTQATFRLLLDALACPGSVLRLPVAARGAPTNPWVAAVLISLLDHEVSLAVETFDGSADLERYVRQRTTVGAAPTDQADFVVASAERLEPTLLTSLRRGTELYPDESASLMLLVPSLEQELVGGLMLALTGPGVPAGRRLRLQGLGIACLEARTEACADYPRGIDLYLLDGAGRIVALPRTTGLEPLLPPPEAA